MRVKDIIDTIKKRQQLLEAEINLMSKRFEKNEEYYENTAEGGYSYTHEYNTRECFMAAYNELSELLDYLKFKDVYENRKYYIMPTQELDDEFKKYGVKLGEAEKEQIYFYTKPEGGIV